MFGNDWKNRQDHLLNLGSGNNPGEQATGIISLQDG